jgi:hypothetical protein
MRLATACGHPLRSSGRHPRRLAAPRTVPGSNVQFLRPTRSGVSRCYRRLRRYRDHIPWLVGRPEGHSGVGSKRSVCAGRCGSGRPMAASSARSGRRARASSRQATWLVCPRRGARAKSAPRRPRGPGAASDGRNRRREHDRCDAGVHIRVCIRVRIHTCIVPASVPVSARPSVLPPRRCGRGSRLSGSPRCSEPASSPPPRRSRRTRRPHPAARRPARAGSPPPRCSTRRGRPGRPPGSSRPAPAA